MKYLLSLIFIMPIIFFTSCSEDDKQNTIEDNQALVGTWRESGSAYEVFEFTFEENGTGFRTVYVGGKAESPDPFTYSFDKKGMRLTLTFVEEHSSSQVYEVKLSDSALEMSRLSGSSEKFQLYKKDGVGNFSPSGGDDTLAGQWMTVEGMPTYIISFSSDKTGSLQIIGNGGSFEARSFKYGYNKNKGNLSIVFNDNNSPKEVSFNIRLSGAANTMMELTCTSGNFNNLTLLGSGVES